MSAEKPTGWALMLVPFSFIDGCDDITGEPRMTVETHMRQAVVMKNKNTTAEQRKFYQSLLEIGWLPSALRRVVMEELGLSLRQQKRKINEAVTITLRKLVEDRKQAMRAQGLRPRGGVHDPAVEEIAQGITSDALKQRLQRLKQRARKTGRH